MSDENTTENSNSSSDANDQKPEVAPAVVETKPEGPPNVTVRNFAEEIINKKDSDTD